MINFTNSLDPDQARQIVRSDLDPKPFDTLMVFLKEIFKKVDFEKISRRQKSVKNYPEGKELKQLTDDSKLKIL